MRLPLAVTTAALVLSATAAPALATNCATVTACVLGQNSAPAGRTDIGIEGTSVNGFGLVGVTSANPSKSGYLYAGLYGKDQGASTYNSGVSAFSENGTGVTAEGVNGGGVLGFTLAASGGYAAFGVGGEDLGTNNENVGVYGQSNVGAGVFGYAPQTGDGVDAEADQSGAAIYAYGGAEYPAVDLVTGGTGDILDLYNGTSTTASPTAVVSFDGSGNEVIAGTLTANTAPTFRTRGTGGTDVASYGARTASPTLEDFGQGAIRAGAGHVVLDPTFASTINTRSYLVFITPHGDSHSLYTTSLTASGFDVRESEHGSSTLSFDYRIVGQPLDTQVAHMPATATLPQFVGMHTHKMRAPIHRARVLSKAAPRAAF